MTRLFSVYGDSISSFEGILPQGWRVFFEGEQLELTGVKTPHDTWWGQVIDHFGGQFLDNASWSGCVVEGRDFPVGASAEIIENLQAERYSSFDSGIGATVENGTASLASLEEYALDIPQSKLIEATKSDHLESVKATINNYIVEALAEA